jgi:hypothetical protein
MGVLGDYLLPSTVTNRTKDLTLIVVDGIDDYFMKVLPGAKSQCWSIDALGGYLGGQEQTITFKGSSSAWWKIPDGVICSVHPVVAGSSGGVEIVTAYRLEISQFISQPTASKAVGPPDWWNCTPEKVQLLVNPPKGFDDPGNKVPKT